MADSEKGLEKSKAEFAQLKREFRHMELNRKSYTDESYQVLRKQQATIAKLRKENEALKAELEAEMERQTLKPSEIAELGKQHEEVERLRAQEASEMKKVQQLDEEIAAMEQKLNQKRKDMGGINAARENQAMVQKQVRILENRLDQALVKFNQSVAKNKELREQIDDLRRERVVFDNIYRKLQRELQEKKRKMANIIESANLAYEKRDNCQMEIAAIEQANRKEQEDFEAQMLELNRILEDELQIPAPSMQASTQQSLANQEATQDDLPQKKQKSKAAAAASTVSKEKQDLQASEERVQNFEEAFNRIKEATGIADIDELVRTFIKNEEQNFSLFNYVNEQNNEIEKLEEEVQQLRDEEQKYMQESGADVNQHQLVLQELDAKIEAAESQAEKYEAKCDEYQKIIDELKQAITSCYTNTERSRLPTEPPTDSPVTEANMLQYLAIIEERCNSLLKKYAAVKAKQAACAASDSREAPADTDEIQALLGLGPTTPMGQDLIHVNPPKLEDYSSEEDEEEEEGETRPLTREELKAKTLNRIHRRNNREAGMRAGSRGANSRQVPRKPKG